MRPATRYVRCGGVRVAYQVVGDGPIDLVFVQAFASHLELGWADPLYARFLRRLSSSARLILFDKPGTGMSDGVSRALSIAERVELIRSVMNAAASERAVLFGFSDGATAALTFAATCPQRCSALILYGAIAADSATTAQQPVFPPQTEERIRDAIDRWGEGRSLALFAPSLAESPLNRRGFALFERASATRELMVQMAEMARTADVRHLATLITVPTLVLHRRDDFVPVAGARHLASLIPDAQFVELEGVDHVPYAGDANALLVEVERFLGFGGSRAGRVAATLLFTDIVASTQRLVALGDDRWRELLGTHDDLARSEITRHDGRFVKHTGDGIVATFDGAANAVCCAWAIREQVRRLDLEIRAGAHSGEYEIVGGDVGGLAVHTAARVLGAAGSGEVLVSAATRELLLGSGITLEPRGPYDLKGLPGTQELFALSGDADTDELALVNAPSAADQLGPGDRVQVAVARRAPALVRSLQRAAVRTS
jgi:class 3 adenylate cyclase